MKKRPYYTVPSFPLVLWEVGFVLPNTLQKYHRNRFLMMLYKGRYYM